MNRIVYFIKMLIVQIPIIWRATEDDRYYYFHLTANNKTRWAKIMRLVKRVDKALGLEVRPLVRKNK